MSYTITFPFLWETIDINNDNVDVCVKTEDGKSYVFVVATPDNVKTLMAKEPLPYLKPGLPFLFVEKLTKENIIALIEALMEEDPALLRIYGEDL